MAAFTQDFRYALRTLAGSPGFTAAAVFSLALGIGANTAIFTLTNALFLNPLPVREGSRILEIYTVDHATQSSAGIGRTGVSLPNTNDIAAQNQVFDGVAAYSQAGVTLTGLGRPTQENAWVVTPGYFDVLGVPAAVGRTFSVDSRTDAVLSDSVARRLFGSAASALGKTINLNSTAYSVIGVAPPGFNGTLSVGPSDPIWLPIAMHQQIYTGPIERLFNERRFRFLSVFARLKPGVDEKRADANLATIAARLEAEYPRDNRGRALETSTLAEAAGGFVAPRNQTVAAALALSIAVGFVLLIACANLANLSLARASRLSREMGIRVALGASRTRLVMQMLSEAAVLSLAGGVMGIGIGWAAGQGLWAARPGFLTNASIDLRLDWRVCLFTAGLSVLSCVLFGVAPVIRASAPNVARLMNTAGRGNVQGGGRSLFRAGLVMGEIALAVVALVGAGLFVRSMQKTQSVDPGFETEHLLVAGINLAPMRMSAEHGAEFIRNLVARVKTVPGVEEASIGGVGPLQGGGLLQTGFHEGDPQDSRLGVLVITLPISPTYLKTMRIPLLEGRELSEFDKATSAPVMLVSEATAKRLWPGQRAIGKRMYFATQKELREVVGIVKDVNVGTIGETPQMVSYLPFEQTYQPGVVLHVKTSGPPEQMILPLEATVRQLGSDLTLVNPGGIQKVIGQALWAPRMAAGLFGVFGMLGMALAMIGVYGVMAFMVQQRTSEIGIRMAVGASPSRVLGMVIGESARLAGVGIGVGLAGALVLTRLVKSMLFEVSPSDPVVYAVVVALLVITALVAGGVPAWRASRIDPMRALRQE